MKLLATLLLFGALSAQADPWHWHYRNYGNQIRREARARERQWRNEQRAAQWRYQEEMRDARREWRNQERAVRREWRDLTRGWRW